MSDALYEKTEEFCRLCGEDRLTAILEASLEIMRQSRESGTVGDITFSDIVKHDAINWTVYGYFQHDGDEVCFNIDNGNWAGTVVNSFGEDTDMEPPTGRSVWKLKLPDRPTWGPKPEETMESYAERVAAWRERNKIIFAHWQSETWFKDLERGMNYDKFFAPGSKTDAHYRDKAARRGLAIGSEWVE
jgi:hypothetical protein